MMKTNKMMIYNIIKKIITYNIKVTYNTTTATINQKLFDKKKIRN
jgi:hypothetical protein